MEILDENGKKREIVEGTLKTVTTQMKNEITGDVETKEFVEFVIHGRTREWKDWCPLDVFRERNPGVRV